MNEYTLFFHGILEVTAAGQEAHNRKAAYLQHLKELVLNRPPIQPLVFSPPTSSEDRFPSLRYVEFIQYPGLGYISLISHFFNIRHVCIRGCNSGMLYYPGLTPIFDKWNVEKITFYNWYDDGTRSMQDVGIPLGWKNLSQITVYPELACNGGIPYLRLCRGQTPMPFMYMPNPRHFPFLKKFTIILPAWPGWEYYWWQYQKYAEDLRDEQKALVEKALVETKNNMWP